MNKKGSIAIETAIAMSIALIFIVSLISITCIRRTDINMQRAVDASCEKFAVFPPLSVTSSDVLSTITNALPDSESLSAQGDSILTGAASLIYGIDNASGHKVMELALDGTLGQIMRDDIAYEFRQRNGTYSSWEPSSIVVDYNINESHMIIEVEVTYKTASILGSRTRTIYSTIPLYGDIDLFINSGESAIDDDNPWGKDNFSRGDYFREKYGANLPKSFPVIDKYKNGQAESIMSIDLTAPTYNCGDESAYHKVCEEIDKLSSFSGAQINIKGDNYEVNGDDITSRVLTLVIPSNASDEVLFEINSAVNYGKSKGVKTVVYNDGESTKYISE